MTKANKEIFTNEIFDFENENEWNYKGSKPAVIDFGADWCQPCKMLDPVLEKLDEEMGDKVIFYKVNVDDNSEIAEKFQIRSIPSILFVPIGEKPQMAQGAIPEENMKEAIKNILKVE